MQVSYEAKTVSELLPVILKDLRDLKDSGSRNGRVQEQLNTRIVVTNPWKREILTPGRKANVFAQIAETCWVLAGRGDVEWLSAYLPRAHDFSDDGETWRAAYGPRIRGEVPGYVDQLRRVLELLKADPMSRQAVIQIWDVTDGAVENDLKDRACNTQLQFQSRLGELHMTVTVRSNDVIWGWSGINSFEWSVLQEILASMLGVGIGPIVYNIANLHLYERHWGKANNILTNVDLMFLGEGFECWDEKFYTPWFCDPLDRYHNDVDGLDNLLGHWFEWEQKCREGLVRPEDIRNAPGYTVSELSLFESWSAAIAYYWTQDYEFRGMLVGTALYEACAATPVQLLPTPVPRATTASERVVEPYSPVHYTANGSTRADFYRYVTELHRVKDKAYGDSWKRRGVTMSILPNIARKVDRLGVSDEHETDLDTAIDLAVYALKFYVYLIRDKPENDLVCVGSQLKTRLHTPIEDTHVAGLAREWDSFLDSYEDLSSRGVVTRLDSLVDQSVTWAYELWSHKPKTLDSGDDYPGADHE